MRGIKSILGILLTFSGPVCAYAENKPSWVSELGYRTDETFKVWRGQLGMPFVELGIGNSTQRCLFDTGNMMGIGLASNVLDQLKLSEIGRWSRLEDSGQVIGVDRHFRAPKVYLFGRSLSDQTIFEFSLPGLAGTIGPDTLPGTRFTLDYRAGLLAVTKSQLGSVPQAFIALPLIRSTRHPQLILTMAQVNGKPVLISLDTGASRTNIDPNLVQALALPMGPHGVSIDSIQIGTLVFSVPSAKVISKAGIDPTLTPSLQLTLGSDILAELILTVDYATGRLLIRDARQQ
jgi:Aspartyl protease